jgi:hypothetical protein
MRKKDGKLNEWKEKRWMKKIGMKRLLKINDGIVNVRDGGI